MPRKLEFIASVTKHGHLPDTRREQIANYLQLFADSDVKVQIGPPIRTTAANNFYHGFRIKPIRHAMLEAGLGPVSHQAVHAYFRDKYLDPVIETVFGEEKLFRPSTTRLDSTEFYWYVEAVKTDELVLPFAIHFEEPEDSYRSYSIEDLPY